MSSMFEEFNFNGSLNFNNCGLYLFKPSNIDRMFYNS